VFLNGLPFFANAQLKIDGSTGVMPLVSALADAYQSQEHKTAIKIGTGLNPQKRIDALLNGEIDIAMASHGIDIQQIENNGLAVHKFAQMAVVMGVNHSVSTTNLTEKQLCQIYSGEITNWGSLGGQEAVIHVFIRPFNEVDTEVIESIVPCFDQSIISKSVVSKAKSGQMARAIAKNPSSIGMTTQVRVVQSDGRIKALAMNGVLPTSENLLNGSYPYTRDSFLITSKHPSDKVLEFLAFIRTEAGSEVITANNAIPAQ
jgi:phosphate transport system substrate-binding protein